MFRWPCGYGEIARPPTRSISRQDVRAKMDCFVSGDACNDDAGGVMHGVVSGLAGVITAIISYGGYAGIALLMAAESACLPLPSEIIMPFAGYLAATGRFNLFLVATFGAVGCNLGSAAAYAVGAWGGRPFIRRWGYLLLMDERELDRAEWLFKRFGAITVFAGRLLPVVRTFIALPAGIARMERWRFHIYTFVGSWIWSFALAYAGYVLGQKWNSSPGLRATMHALDGVAVVLLAGGIGFFIWSRLRSRKGGAARR